MKSRGRANDRWVITSSTPSPTREPRSCFTDSGSSSQIRAQWAQFYAWQSAKDWAAKNHIEVDDVIHCIVQTTFSDFDISAHNSAS